MKPQSPLDGHRAIAATCLEPAVRTGPAGASAVSGELSSMGGIRPQGSHQSGRAKPGPWRVLLWKEWRQQRWTLLGMTALALALFVLGGFLGKRWSFGLSGAVWTLVIVGLPLVLSARAFAGEDEDGTAIFLRELPFQPLQVFAAKFLVGVLASWSALGLLTLLSALWTAYPDNAIGSVPWAAGALSVRGRVVVWVSLCLLAPVAAALASLLASLGLRSLTTALLDGAGLLVCAGAGGVSLYCLYAVKARGFVVAGSAALVLGLVILAAAGLSARRHPRPWVRFARGLGGFLAVLTLFLGPAIPSALYVGVLATPEDYRLPAWWRAPLGQVLVVVPPANQPAGVLLACELRSGVGLSLAWLAPNQPRPTWTDTRLLPLDLWDMAIAWSPTGTRAAWREWDRNGSAHGLGWLSGVVQRSSRQGRGIEFTHVSVLDTGTGRRVCVSHDLAADWLLDGSPWSGKPGAWYSDTWLTGRQGFTQRSEPRPLGIGFVNVDDGSSRVCGLPSGDSGERWRYWAGNKVVLPNRAVFVAVWRHGASGTEPQLLVARCTPDDAEATVTRVTAPLPLATRLEDVSPDECWAVFGTPNDRGLNERLDVVDLATGAPRRLALPPDMAERMAEGRCGLDVVGFVGDGRRLLVAAGALCALYDPGRDAWRVCAPPACSGLWRVSPDRRRVLQACHADGSGPPVVLILDVASLEWSSLPLGETHYSDVQWYGNEYVLAMTTTGLWKLGLDGSRDLLWPRE